MDDADDRALRVRAANAVDHTRSLAMREPAWGSGVHRLAGGWMVLAGAGMYINQAVYAGIREELTPADLVSLQIESSAVQVPPAIEVVPTSLTNSVRLIRNQGFVHDPTADITLLTRSITARAIAAPQDVVIRPVESRAEFRLWQETSAIGWGHTAASARKTSDAFAAAAFALDNEFMAVAFDKGDGRPVGCASMTVRDGVVMIGGMSVVPAERRRGVQAALVRYRLDRAHGMGCDLAMTTAARDGASQRNLERHGFSPRFTIEKFAPVGAAVPGRSSRSRAILGP